MCSRGTLREPGERSAPPPTMKRKYDNITLVITSCDRFDLLERTLESMDPWLDDFPEKIIVEDSNADPGLFDRLGAEGFRVIVNGHRLGQLASIDIAYGECNTEFIFHCEDDWEFIREPGIEAACHVLEHGTDGEGEFSVVCFRDVTGTKGCKPELFRDRMVQGSLFRYSFQQKNKFNYFTFNPAMIRYDFYKRYGLWRKFTNERSIARTMRRQGHCIAREIPGSVRHIGKGRSRIRSRNFRWMRDTTRKWFGPHGILRGG